MIPPIKNGFIGGIEAMRGIAVIAVIMYHFNADLIPSGFLGVDLFFIISGFIVTKSFYRIKAKNIYGYLLHFYSARLKRVFPALIVFVFLTFILLVLMDQINIIGLRTGGTSLLGLSNLYLILIHDNYFNLNQEFNVFNHTWSLGVEEQFYFILPILLYFLKYHQNKLIYASLVLATISFSIYVSSSENLAFQYYSPITRFWQLMLGSVAYQLHRRYEININPIWTKLFFLLVISCFFFDKRAIAITIIILSVASVLLILGVSSKGNNTISNKYLIYIGGISYSLYLYHLPIIKLFNLPGYWSIAQFVLLFIVAIASVELVEKPFRYGKLSGLSKREIIIFFSISAVILSLLIVGYSFFIKHGDYFSRPNHDRINSVIWNEIAPLKSSTKRSLFFIGDSHSDALTPMMLMLHKKDNFQINSIQIGGLFTTSLDSKSHGNLSIRGKIVLEYVLENGRTGDVLIITNQLMQYFGETYNQPNNSVTFDGKLLTKEDALLVYSSDLESIADTLLKKGMDIIILSPFPDFPYHPINCYSPFLNSIRISMKYNKCTISKMEQEKRRSGIVTSLKKISKKYSNFYTIDPIDIVTSEKNYISSYKNATPLYYDDDHPNFIFNQYIYLLFKKQLNSM